MSRAAGQDRWALSEEIFHGALESGPEERERVIDERCAGQPELAADVRRLLRGHDLAERRFIEPPTLAGDDVRGAAAQPPVLPERIGRYRVVRLIASGGMGAVYEAQQESPRRAVAVKVMRAGLPSPAMVRRFLHESEALARLRHPGIAQVFEAGTYDAGSGPAPFFAMEFIPDAQPITEYAGGRALTVRQRLELFVRVCDAVHHGHQRGVIHRDLKPGNILIDPAGAPKVIDFGVARITDPDTATVGTDAGQLVGTVAYMSPEQCTADPRELDTRTDVYSLGVVLYELLCGCPPCDVRDKPILEAARIIRESPARKPSSVVRALRGDTETILLAALDKDKARRYQSVAELAADIRRCLGDEPISARPSTTLYQLRKFARRNRTLAVGSALALAGLLLGLGGATWQAARAIHQRDRAVVAEAAARTAAAREAEEADAARRFARCLESAIGATEPPASGAAAVSSPAATLNASADTILRELNDRPLAQADLLDRLGGAYVRMGLMERARSVLGSSLRIRTRELGEDHAQTTGTLDLLAQACVWAGDPQQAEELLRRILRILPPGPSPDGRRSHAGQSLARMLVGRGVMEEAEAVARQAVRDGPYAGAVGRARALLADIRSHRGDLAGARAECGAAIEEARLGGDLLLVARLQITLATLEERQGEQQAAQAMYSAGMETWESRRGDRSLDAAFVATEIATLLRGRSRSAWAEAFLREALAIDRDLLGPRSTTVADLSARLGGVLWEDHRDMEAAPLFRDATLIYRLVAGDEHTEVGTCMFRLGQIASALGDMAALRRLRPDAEDLLRLSRSLPEDHPHRSGALLLLGLIDTSLGDAAAAEPLLRQCVALRERLLGPEDRLTAYAQTILGACLTGLGRYPEAEVVLLEAVARVTAGYPPESRMTEEARARVVALYEAWGKGELAEPYRRPQSVDRAQPGTTPPPNDAQPDKKVPP